MATKRELQELIYEINNIIGNKRLKLAGKIEEIRERLDQNFQDDASDSEEVEEDDEQ